MSQQSEFIWFNGKMVPYAQATTHVLSHAIHYGSSVFEGVRAYDTPNGPAIFRLTDHIKRMFDSAKIYRMEIPYTLEELVQACKDTVAQNGFKDAYLRPFAYLGHVGLGLNPKSHVAEVSVAAMQWGAYLGEDSLAEGVDVCISSWNRLAPNTMPTAAKAGGNYLSSQLISGEAKRNGYVEGIALDTNGMLSEGAGENLFVIKKGVLYTPPTTACILPGLTRDTIMTLANEFGYEVREEAIAREALYLADEFFMTGTAAEIVPVRSVDRITVGSGKRGPITEHLQKAYFDLVKGQSADPHGWLEYVSA
ncbi:branched-chain amino acid transaminase [Pseudoalteromonas tunicata]|uniref:Branched-chain-amino-acid aminotransferase n=1 Tax=Pseudoalteromonas tunicata D2 TaxID=87626 RepID=A4C7V6_9GAMM|nr:branched-chain amino acid transaminase [Pseudoalteromonas tunicata]ATC93177.1 branched-chain amino acid aminotransferase [Pseudoalteromonas tunicata]AXT32244.1 branched-chain amino acid transaminase [Pseudoalteromonas tunicata]EAR28671.1 branched-chain amino acid aminotransferase [Pseudoalteromonas tunicata D2]MDP4983391.1 branched-chain amino acid transaminase [Pseudoalteromonas tunicata]MDP5212728.1 branched-chain amino acid transaminase [Pseudoalteromonas tunicata]